MQHAVARSPGRPNLDENSRPFQVAPREASRVGKSRRSAGQAINAAGSPALSGLPDQNTLTDFPIERDEVPVDAHRSSQPRFAGPCFQRGQKVRIGLWRRERLNHRLTLAGWRHLCTVGRRICHGPTARERKECRDVCTTASRMRHRRLERRVIEGPSFHRCERWQASNFGRVCIFLHVEPGSAGTARHLPQRRATSRSGERPFSPNRRRLERWVTSIGMAVTCSSSRVRMAFLTASHDADERYRRDHRRGGEHIHGRSGLGIPPAAGSHTPRREPEPCWHRGDQGRQQPPAPARSGGRPAPQSSGSQDCSARCAAAPVGGMG